MTIEQITSRSRLLLTLISAVGALALAVGIVLLTKTLDHTQADLHQDWAQALAECTPSLIIAAAGLLTVLLPWALYPVLALAQRLALDQASRDEQLMGAIESQRQLLEAVRDTSTLSDAAKSIAYRHKDREALRQAIREDIDKGDFEAALQLVDDMDERFGYRQEAQRLREEIEDGSRAARERMIHDQISQIDEQLRRFNWDEAERVHVRLSRIYPDHADVKRIPDRVQLARDSHKRELLKQWKDALAKDDVDASVALLKELDQYLSPSEAEAYKESARDVFRKRLQQMGVQFALHVHDKAWSDAVRIGRQITDEFPNTRIAAEVREKMAILLEKANQPAGV